MKISPFTSLLFFADNKNVQHSCLQAKRPGYSEGTALIPAGFRPQDGKRQKERSDILFMFEEYKPLMIGGAATDAAITITVMDIILARSFRNK
ncbi:hypothetical protein [Pantoea vagans]|uniref:hypothetical protein n=1 Tax=Pantoea vagans TaxID=470934 RepID=UPI003671DBBB